MDYKTKYFKYKAKYLQLLDQIGSGIDQDKMLLEGALDGDLNKVQLALDQGANINARGRGLTTPLLNASRNNHLEIVKLLIERGANIEGEDNAKITPLMIALYHYSDLCVRFLLEQNVNIQHLDTFERTPLIIVCNWGHLEFIRKIIYKGGDSSINHQDMYGMTALINICNRTNYQADQYQVVNLLLDRGANTELVTNEEHNTALLLTKNPAVVELLLNRGANINHINKSGKTALRIASEYGIYMIDYIPIIKILLMRGATMDERILENIKQIPEHFFENPHDKEIILNNSTNMLLYSLKQSGTILSPENVEDIVSFNKP